MSMYESQNIYATWALLWPFFWFLWSFYDDSSYGSTFKIPSINDGFNPNLNWGATNMNLLNTSVILNEQSGPTKPASQTQASFSELQVPLLLHDVALSTHWKALHWFRALGDVPPGQVSQVEFLKQPFQKKEAAYSYRHMKLMIGPFMK